MCVVQKLHILENNASNTWQFVCTSMWLCEEPEKGAGMEGPMLLESRSSTALFKMPLNFLSSVAFPNLLRGWPQHHMASGHGSLIFILCACGICRFRIILVVTGTSKLSRRDNIWVNSYLRICYTPCMWLLPNGRQKLSNRLKKTKSGHHLVLIGVVLMHIADLVYDQAWCSGR